MTRDRDPLDHAPHDVPELQQVRPRRLAEQAFDAGGDFPDFSLDLRADLGGIGHDGHVERRQFVLEFLRLGAELS